MSLATKKSNRSKKPMPKICTSFQSPNDNEQNVPKTRHTTLTITVANGRDRCRFLLK